MSEKTAKFRLKEYKINQAGIAFNPLRNPKNMSIEMVRRGTEKDKLYMLELDVSVEDKENEFKVHAHIIAHFEFDSDINEEMKNIFFKINAPAILFPYVRAYISTLTSLSGIKPIIIPTINLAEGETK